MRSFLQMNMLKQDLDMIKRILDSEGKFKVAEVRNKMATAN